MKNVEKQELVRIIKSIPSDIFYTWKITKLWKRYGYDFTYATFRNYLKAFRRIRREDTLKAIL